MTLPDIDKSSNFDHEGTTNGLTMTLPKPRLIKGFEPKTSLDIVEEIKFANSEINSNIPEESQEIQGKWSDSSDEDRAISWPSTSCNFTRVQKNFDKHRVENIAKVQDEMLSLN